ncbi:hypothetical protein GEMRC1_004262 [Eukaryota sp. GEM-RC1]
MGEITQFPVTDIALHPAPNSFLVSFADGSIHQYNWSITKQHPWDEKKSQVLTPYLVTRPRDLQPQVNPVSRFMLSSYCLSGFVVTSLNLCPYTWSCVGDNNS